MIRKLTLTAAIGLAVVLPARAADLPVKVRPAPPPVASWTGFYVGGQIGGGWGDRQVTYAGNDIPSANRINGISTLPGSRPVASHGVDVSGVTGGLTAGYNWQISPNWLVGIETDFSGSGIKGSGNGTSTLQATPTFLSQTVSSEQTIDWWGTVRGRLGFLARDDLLLFGTAGFAYGKVAVSDSYIFAGPPAAVIAVSVGGISYSCNANVTCFSGANSSVKTGWTAGGGGEWRVAPRWTVKAEYLYVNLGSASVIAVAGTPNAPGDRPSSYTADFGRTDFHIGRVGFNYQF